MTKNKIEIKRLHIELTSNCKLFCPLCPRSTTRDRYDGLHLDIELLKQRLDSEVLNKLEDICFSGVYGDPIYYPYLYEVIKHIKNIKNLPISIETNGSYQNKKFWEHLVSLLNNKEDTIIFSVDGLEDTNGIYRVNSSWPDIMEGITICTKKINTVWKYIIFKHNEHQIEEAKALAKELKINKFILVNSGHFDINKEILKSSKMKKSINKLRPSSKETNMVNNKKVFHPKCSYGRRFYISSDGYLGPCCWLSQYKNRRSLFNFDIDYQDFNLVNSSILEIINSKSMINIQKLWQNEIGPCLNYCNVNEADITNIESVHKKNNIFI